MCLSQAYNSFCSLFKRRCKALRQVFLSRFVSYNPNLHASPTALPYASPHTSPLLGITGHYCGGFRHVSHRAIRPPTTETTQIRLDLTHRFFFMQFHYCFAVVRFLLFLSPGPVLAFFQDFRRSCLVPILTSNVSIPPFRSTFCLRQHEWF